MFRGTRDNMHMGAHGDMDMYNRSRLGPQPMMQSQGPNNKIAISLNVDRGRGNEDAKGNKRERRSKKFYDYGPKPPSRQESEDLMIPQTPLNEPQAELRNTNMDINCPKLSKNTIYHAYKLTIMSKSNG
jgi:hypothetical protein